MKILKTAAISLFSLTIISGCTNNQTVGMPNPWVDCGTDMNCVKQTAGFDFPLKLDKYSARAMKDMAEIKYTLPDNRVIVLRKAEITPFANISGDYTDYPVKQEGNLADNIFFNIEGDENKFYVANFENFGHAYSIACKQGMTIEDILSIYEMIKKVEK